MKNTNQLETMVKIQDARKAIWEAMERYGASNVVRALNDELQCKVLEAHRAGNPRAELVARGIEQLPIIAVAVMVLEMPEKQQEQTP